MTRLRCVCACFSGRGKGGGEDSQPEENRGRARCGPVRTLKATMEENPVAYFARGLPPVTKLSREADRENLPPPPPPEHTTRSTQAQASQGIPWDENYHGHNDSLSRGRRGAHPTSPSTHRCHRGQRRQTTRETASLTTPPPRLQCLLRAWGRAAAHISGWYNSSST